MDKSSKRKRKLGVEGLEARQMLHGGAFACGADAEDVFARLDTNEDGVILVSEEGGDDISERMWEKLSAADTDDEAGVNLDELTAHIDAKQAERAENGFAGRRGRRGGGRFGGGTPDPTELVDRVFSAKDDGDDLLTESELGRAWERLSEIAGEDGAVSREELFDYVSEKIAERETADEDDGGGDDVAAAATTATSQMRFRGMGRMRR